MRENNYRIGDCVEDADTHEPGSVVYCYRADPQLKDIVVVKFGQARL